MSPWRRIDTLFLDAGNTLVSIDFPWVAEVLAERGVAVAPEALARAEASARPDLSEWLGGQRSTESEDTFRFYVRNVLQRLEPVARRAPEEVEALADALVPILRRRGASDRLWRKAARPSASGSSSLATPTGRPSAGSPRRACVPTSTR